MMNGRSWLWYIGFLVILPLWVYGLSSGKLYIALLGLPLFIVCIIFSLKKRSCKNCGKVTRTANAKVTRCCFCGSEFQT